MILARRFDRAGFLPIKLDLLRSSARPDEASIVARRTRHHMEVNELRRIANTATSFGRNAGR
jgi:hypothetical protein